MPHKAKSASGPTSAAFNEPASLAALWERSLLDGTPDEHFDLLARLAARVLHAPAALVCLASDDRQFFKGAFGLPEPWASRREMPLSQSLCQHVVTTGEALAIADARRHPLGGESFAVRTLNIVAYLGIPLTTSNGQVLGSFCVIDSKPREWSAAEIDTVRDLAAAVTRDIALRSTMGERDRLERIQQSEQTLFDIEERLRHVLKALRAGLWEADFTSSKVYFSPETYELFGLPPGAAPTDYRALIFQAIHPDDRATVQAMTARVIAGGEHNRVSEGEYRIIRPDGAILWIHSAWHVEKDEQGRALRILGINRDITARKHAEQAQRESERFVRKIVDVAASLIYVYDHDKKRRIYGPADDTLGYASVPDESERAFIDSVIHPDDQERVAAFRSMLRTLPDNTIAEFEGRYRHADGSWRWLRARNAVFARKPDGTVQQTIGTTTDVTAIKRAEEELRLLNAELEQRVAARTAELTAANRELEAFAYSVSHDLRAPLRAIDGFSRLLQNFDEQLAPEARGYVRRVRDAAKHMAELIEALLALSRTTLSGLSLCSVDMSALAAAVIVELRRAEPGRQIETLIAKDVRAMGDTRMLRIVLENLLGNAWKFTGGREAARIEFGAELQHGERVYFVRDNGVGFDMAHATRLFVPFQRLHTTEEFTGTGIGLATVRRIVTRHGGRIWAQSAPDQGATFYFTLASDTDSALETRVNDDDALG